MDLLDFIKEVFKVLNVNDIDALFWVFVSLITIMLYRHFYKNIDNSKKREDEEIKNNLEVFSRILFDIKKHDQNKLDSENLYFELHKLLPICSTRLKNKIINVDPNDKEEFKKVKDSITKEFNSLKYDQHVISKKYTDNAFDFYGYHLRNNGFFLITIATFSTILSLIAILIFISFFIKMATVNTLSKIALSAAVVFATFYLFLLISYIDLFIVKRIRFNVFNNIAMIIMIFSPLIFNIRINLITIAVFCLIIGIYIFFIFPKTIKEESTIQS